MIPQRNAAQMLLSIHRQSSAAFAMLSFILYSFHLQTSAACIRTFRSGMWCWRSPAEEASCSGVSAVLSCPLRTAAPSTLAPASNRSWRCKTSLKRCLNPDRSFFTRGMHSWLTPPNSLHTHTRDTSCGCVCEGVTNLHDGDVSVQHSEGESRPASTVGVH